VLHRQAEDRGHGGPCREVHAEVRHEAEKISVECWILSIGEEVAVSRLTDSAKGTPLNTQHQKPNTQAMYGGQAVIEGVMMRGPQHFAVACRRANGEIALTCERVPKVFRPAWQKVPFVRGMFAL